MNNNDLSKPSAAPRRLVPSLVGLESRCLLSFLVTSNGQDGHDFVGPNASQGDDGIQDLDLSLSNMSYASINVDYINVTAPGGFEWQTAANPSGYSFAEFFPSTSNAGDPLYQPPGE